MDTKIQEFLILLDKKIQRSSELIKRYQKQGSYGSAQAENELVNGLRRAKTLTLGLDK